MNSKIPHEFQKLKNKAYNFLVDRNYFIKRDYKKFVEKENKRKHKRILISLICVIWLNFKYRILRINDQPDNVKRKQTTSKHREAYVNGPESSRIKRSLPIHLAARLIPYDIISMDIFDTLIFRPFSKPSELFRFVGKQLDVHDFHDIRIGAQKEAVKRKQQENGISEVNIYDIYKVIEEITGIPVEIGVAAELETELEFCYPNPYMQRVYKLLSSLNKKMIVVSDMYLPRDMIDKILQKCGYTFSDIIVSCDEGCTKRSGKLFEKIKERFKDQKIIHIGDNWVSDIQSAKAAQIDTNHYKNVNIAGGKHRPDQMTRIIASAYSGIVNAHFYNGIKSYTASYEYGFAVGGIYVLGFCTWIKEYAIKHKVDKILFLARDGKIYQEVFNKLDVNIPNEYVYWSRIPANFVEAKNDRALFLDEFIDNKARRSEEEATNLRTILAALKLIDWEVYCPLYGIEPSAVICEENKDAIRSLFIDHWNELLSTLEKKCNDLGDYFRNVIGDSKNILLIDIGWRGRNTNALKKYLVNEINSECNVSILLAAGVLKNEEWLLDGTIQTYMFSNHYNRNLYNYHLKNRNSKYHTSAMFEMLSQDSTPSFIGIEDGKFVFDEPLVENKAIIQDIHKGISDFADIYLKTFRNYQFMYHIPGHDAYTPFSFYFKTIRYFNRNFPGYRMSITTLATAFQGKTIREFVLAKNEAAKKTISK